MLAQEFGDLGTPVLDPRRIQFDPHQIANRPVGDGGNTGVG